MRKLFSSLLALTALWCWVGQVSAANPLPKFSDNSSTYWYYIMFTRVGNSTTGVLEDKGDDAIIQTASFTQDKDEQLWKIVGTTNDGTLQLISKAGRTVYYDGTTGRFKTAVSPTTPAGFGIADCTKNVPQAYQLLQDNNASYGMNTNGGSGIGREIGRYNDDGNNSILFISEYAKFPQSDQWYYILYTEKNVYIPDKGDGVYIDGLSANTLSYSDEYMWRIVAETDGVYLLQSKTGRYLKYPGSNQYTTTPTINNADKFAILADVYSGNDAGQAGENNKALTWVLRNYNLSTSACVDGTARFQNWNSIANAATSLAFAPITTYPKFSAGGANDPKYYYRIHFSNRGHKKTIQDNGAGMALSQADESVGVQGQWWIVKGTAANNLQIESYLGNQISDNSNKTATTGNTYELEKSSHRGLDLAPTARNEGNIRWQLHRSGTSGTSYAINSAGGWNSTSVGEWSANDYNNSLNFKPVPSVILKSASATLDFGNLAPGMTSAAQTISVEGWGLGSDISWTAPTGYSVTKASGWDDREGGSLQITFEPTAVQTYNETLTLTSTGCEIPLAISLSGAGVNTPAISANPTALSFSEIIGKVSLSQSITITGRNLTSDDINYTITGANATDFSVSSNSSASSVFSVPQTISVTFTPGAIGTRIATLQITGGGLTAPVEVALTGGGLPEYPFVSTAGYPKYYYMQVVGQNIANDFATDKGEDQTVKIEPANGSDSQLWRVEANGNVPNQYKIYAKTEKPLIVNEGYIVPSNTTGQNFTLTEVSSGVYTFKIGYTNNLNNTNNSLSVVGAASSFSFIDPEVAILPTISSDEHEYWYQIIKANDSKALQDAGRGVARLLSSQSPEKPVASETSNNANSAQYWKFVPGGRGGVRIVSYAGNAILTEYNGSSGTYLKAATVAEGDGHEYVLEWKDVSNKWMLRGLDRRSTTGTNYYYITSGLECWSISSGGTFSFVPVSSAENTNAVLTSSESTSALSDNKNIVFKEGGEISDANPYTVSNGVVKVVKTFDTNKWYPIGFPFDIDNSNIKIEYTESGVTKTKAGFIYNEDNNEIVSETPTNIANATNDNFYLAFYDGVADKFKFTDNIEKDKGYIIEFSAEDFGNSVTVTFTSTANPSLTSTGSVSVGSGYSLVANPGVANAAGSVFNGASYFYEYDLATQHFDRIDGGTSLKTDIKPFEALVVTAESSNLRSSIGIGATETPVALPAVITKDPVVRTEYYNLQGQRYSISLKNGISAGTPYIVKEVHQSGKVTSKVISGK